LSLLQSQIFLPTKRKLETISSAREKMLAGYRLKSDFTVAERCHILENFPDAAVIRIESAGLHGGRHYSIYDLIGHSINGMVYLVTNTHQFNQFISAELERDFKNKNPEADSRIRAPFTSFMHENKLHWSMCCKKRMPSYDYRSEELVTKMPQKGLVSGEMWGREVLPPPENTTWISYREAVPNIRVAITWIFSK